MGLILLVARAALEHCAALKLRPTDSVGNKVQMKGWQTLLAVDGEVTEEIKWPLRCTVRQRRAACSSSGQGGPRTRAVDKYAYAPALSDYTSAALTSPFAPLREAVARISRIVWSCLEI